MTPASVPSSFASGTEAITLVVLLTEFAMFRVAMSRSQVKLYCLQSLAVSVLAVFVAANQHIGELYVLAGLSFFLKVVIVPGIVMRLLRDTRVDLSGSNRFGVATMILIAIAISVFGFFVVSGLPVYAHSMPSAPFGLAMAVILVAFLLVILRSDVVSQAFGFFALENGVSVASLVLAARLPLVADIGFLFDLLVAVVVFGVLIRVHHGRAGTLSTQVLDRLRG